MNRRQFLESSAILSAAAVAVPASLTAKEVKETKHEGKLITSCPMLQNYAPTSIGIVFSVSGMANGYAFVSEQEDMSGSRKVKCGGYRVTGMDDKIIQIRVTGLKPSTRYYYTIAADRIDYVHGHKMILVGTESDPRVYSFVTAGRDTESHFCVINDTHAVFPTFDALTKKIKSLNPSCVIWNGDTSSSNETIESQVNVFLNPDIDNKDYASEIPYLFCPGNHDSRGLANRHMERAWMFRQYEERTSKDWDLGRNFAVRMGDIAMIGLDTAEDKLDSNPIYCGLFTSEDYRRAQTGWLKNVLRRKEIASAPYLIAFCHIPLFDSDPTSNPGDVYPDDNDSRYSSDFAYWQRTCGMMWGPLLEKAGCKLVVTGHMHRFRYDGPAKDRKWAQLVGGGHNLSSKHSYPTVIDGKIKDGKLVVTVFNVADDSVVKEFSFSKRR